LLELVLRELNTVNYFYLLSREAILWEESLEFHFIGALPTTPFLPRRRGVVESIVSTSEHTLVHTVEDLVDLALQ
jgi:hypothetical protein